MNVHAQPAEAGTRFARRVFLLAGIVGMLELLPLYFYEPTLNRTQPPALTHPEFYYGFLGVALAWQIAFLVISRDPVRFLPLLPALVLEKLLYPVAAFALLAQGRLSSPAAVAPALLDLVWLTLFVVAGVKMGRGRAAPMRE
jgi:hypothetical protein